MASRDTSSKRERWEAAADGFAKFCERWPRYRLLAERGVERLPRLRDARILDLGCGVGESTSVLAMKATRGSIVAVDFSASCVRYAKAKVRDPRVSFLIADAMHFLGDPESTKNGGFDLIFCSAVVWQLEPIELFFTLARSVANASARLMINWCPILTPLPFHTTVRLEGSESEMATLARELCLAGWSIETSFNVAIKENAALRREFTSIPRICADDSSKIVKLAQNTDRLRVWTFVIAQRGSGGQGRVG